MHLAKITEQVENAEATANQYPVTFGDDQRTEVMNYNAVVDLMNKQIEIETKDPSAIIVLKIPRMKY